MKSDESFTQRVVEVFLRGNLSIMLILISLLLGAAALGVTPRGEEPRIIVPLADVHVSAPGLSAEQVERQIATRLDKLLYQIDGVEYVPDDIKGVGRQTDRDRRRAHRQRHAVKPR